MNTLVLGAAPMPGAEGFYRRLLARADRVVAADAAGEWSLRLGRTPDIVVGDFDSAQPGAIERLRGTGVAIRRVSPDKDSSDLALAMREALLDAPALVTVSAAATGRLDHTLAALGELVESAAASSETVVEMREPGMTVWPADAHGRSSLSFEAPLGTTVSLLAVGDAHDVEAHGLRWPLSASALPALGSLGLSNRTVDPTVSVRVGAGTVLVIVLADEARLLPSG